jgi:nitrogen-specific signal transduction histidine kinase
VYAESIDGLLGTAVRSFVVQASSSYTDDEMPAPTLEQAKANAAFIAALDPQTVLVLIRAAEERDRYLTELQGLYEAFRGSGHSPKNPREAAQAIGQLHDGEEERELLNLCIKEADKIVDDWYVNPSPRAYESARCALKALLEARDEDDV